MSKSREDLVTALKIINSVCMRHRYLPKVFMERVNMLAALRSLTPPPDATPQSIIIFAIELIHDIQRVENPSWNGRRLARLTGLPFIRAKSRQKPKNIKDAVYPAPTKEGSQKHIDEFYESWDWKRLRYDFIKEKDRRCQCCGATSEHGTRIVVDHIKPIRHYWHLRLDRANLQVLCDDCNMGKGSRDETNWGNVVAFSAKK